MTELLKYFSNDDLAASVWKGKYALKGEETPFDMHLRMANEFSKKEFERNANNKRKINYSALSEYGQFIHKRWNNASVKDLITIILSYLDKFKHIVPQGSIMSTLGNSKVQSLSNCFVIPPPYDSYGGIFKTDQEIAQLEKRRGGVGTNLNTLRPEETVVNNAAGTSTGAHSFMPRYSNTTREVAQNGRRGALMLLMSCLHPDIFKFVNKKKDRTQVTGANISTMLTDKFMEAAMKDEDFICRFPVDFPIDGASGGGLEYYKLTDFNTTAGKVSIMKIKAKELYDLIVENAHDNAEPGIAYIDRIIDYCPEGVYPKYIPIASNPCGEQWMQAYDACRLLAVNLYNLVINHFQTNSLIDYKFLYEVFYIQQRLADIVVDLEIDYVQRIIDKIKSDKEPNDVKAIELKLWETIQQTAKSSRRTGCGFTALGDMLASLNMKYDSDKAIRTIEQVMKTKMKAELDCTIDLAILYGTFEEWDQKLEFAWDSKKARWKGNNTFYQMLCDEFPEQVERMVLYGRRNVSWSTVAPTGSVSILTQTTSGLEPLFLPYYMRRKKVNPSDKDVRVDFKDANGDCWMEYAVLHPKFEDWIKKYCIEEKVKFGDDEINLTFESVISDKERIENLFKLSPWYQSCANDISWEKRIDIQSIIQKYTTNAISSTINLPRDISKETVANIYKYAWERGLKGVTVYRDGCRDGVLVSTTQEKNDIFTYKDAVKRPKILDGKIYDVRVRGELYNIIVGLLDKNPYEVFVTKWGTSKGMKDVKIVKAGKGKYNIKYTVDGEIDTEANITSEMSDEESVITRLISSALRHGTDVKFLVEQLNKTHGDMTSFSKAIARTLKHFIPEGAKSTIACSECGGSNVIFQEGCNVCKDCGHSRCG